MQSAAEVVVEKRRKDFFFVLELLLQLHAEKWIDSISVLLPLLLLNTENQIGRSFTAAPAPAENMNGDEGARTFSIHI